MEIDKIMDLMEYVADLIQRLDKIAKYLDPNSTANFEDINDVMEKCISANIVLIEITYGYHWGRIERIEESLLQDRQDE